MKVEKEEIIAFGVISILFVFLIYCFFQEDKDYKNINNFIKEQKIVCTTCNKNCSFDDFKISDTHYLNIFCKNCGTLIKTYNKEILLNKLEDKND